MLGVPCVLYWLAVTSFVLVQLTFAWLCLSRLELSMYRGRSGCCAERTIHAFLDFVGLNTPMYAAEPAVATSQSLEGFYALLIITQSPT